MNLERIKIIIRQSDPYAKTADFTRVGSGCINLTSLKHLEINYFHV